MGDFKQELRIGREKGHHLYCFGKSAEAIGEKRVAGKFDGLGCALGTERVRK